MSDYKEKNDSISSLSRITMETNNISLKGAGKFLSSLALAGSTALACYKIDLYEVSSPSKVLFLERFSSILAIGILGVIGSVKLAQKGLEDLPQSRKIKDYSEYASLNYQEDILNQKNS